MLRFFNDSRIRPAAVRKRLQIARRCAAPSPACRPLGGSASVPGYGIPGTAGRRSSPMPSCSSLHRFRCGRPRWALRAGIAGKAGCVSRTCRLRRVAVLYGVVLFLFGGFVIVVATSFGCQILDRRGSPVDVFRRAQAGIGEAVRMGLPVYLGRSPEVGSPAISVQARSLEMTLKHRMAEMFYG
jgi:hypothetical protein